jgi:hypothetical protein
MQGWEELDEIMQPVISIGMYLLFQYICSMGAGFEKWKL